MISGAETSSTGGRAHPDTRGGKGQPEDRGDVRREQGQRDQKIGELRRIHIRLRLEGASVDATGLPDKRHVVLVGGDPVTIQRRVLSKALAANGGVVRIPTAESDARTAVESDEIAVPFPQGQNYVAKHVPCGGHKDENDEQPPEEH